MKEAMEYFQMLPHLTAPPVVVRFVVVRGLLVLGRGLRAHYTPACPSELCGCTLVGGMSSLLADHIVTK